MVSFPLPDTDTITPVPNLLCSTLRPTVYSETSTAFAAGLAGFAAAAPVYAGLNVDFCSDCGVFGVFAGTFPISSCTKRLRRLFCRWLNLNLHLDDDTYNRSFARVIATYIRRRSSSILSSLSMTACDDGKMFSSSATINTTGNSSPFTACIVASVTLLLSSISSASEISATILKKSSMVFPGLSFLKRLTADTNSFRFSTLSGSASSALYISKSPDAFRTYSEKATASDFPAASIRPSHKFLNPAIFCLVPALSPSTFSIFFTTSKRCVPFAPAHSISFCTVVSPMPRRGTLIILAALSLSNGFIAMRR